MNDCGRGPDKIKLGDLRVCRLGFGAMQLTGREVWGDSGRGRQLDNEADVAVAYDLGGGLSWP